MVASSRNRLLALAFVTLLAACGTEPVGPRVAFVEELRGLGAPRQISDRDLIQHGRAICDALGDGKSEHQVRAIMHNARIWPDGSAMPDALTDDLASIMTAVRHHLCPRAGFPDAGTPV